MILLQGVSAQFGDFNLTGLCLEVEEREYYIVLGPSGAGKTLLLEIIAGLHPVSAGRVFIRGKDATRLPPESRRVGMVYQDYGLFPHLTAGENIAYGLRQNKAPADEVKNKTTRAAEFFSLSRLLERRPGDLSGGEKQRVALARALVPDPQVLLLDEPLSALDGPNKKKIRRELTRIHKELGKTVLHITHDMEEALALGEKVAVMDQGRIVQAGLLEEVFRRPANQFVAQFVGHDNIFRGEIKKSAGEKTVVTVEGIDFYLAEGGFAAGKKGNLLIPADGILLSPTPLNSSARNVFPGVVGGVEKTGLMSCVRLDMGIPLTIAVTNTSVTEMDIRPGKRFFAACKASSLHFFA